MNTTDIIILGTIIAYLVGMVLVGIGFSRKNENVGDFYLGGRKLGPLVTAMSAEASDMSSWLLMGLPGVAYLTGGAVFLLIFRLFGALPCHNSQKEPSRFVHRDRFWKFRVQSLELTVEVSPSATGSE